MSSGWDRPLTPFEAGCAFGFVCGMVVFGLLHAFGGRLHQSETLAPTAAEARVNARENLARYVNHNHIAGPVTCDPVLTTRLVCELPDHGFVVCPIAPGAQCWSP